MRSISSFQIESSLQQRPPVSSTGGRLIKQRRRAEKTGTSILRDETDRQTTGTGTTNMNHPAPPLQWKRVNNRQYHSFPPPPRRGSFSSANQRPDFFGLWLFLFFRSSVVNNIKAVNIQANILKLGKSKNIHHPLRHTSPISYIFYAVLRILPALIFISWAICVFFRIRLRQGIMTRRTLFYLIFSLLYNNNL